MKRIFLLATVVLLLIGSIVGFLIFYQPSTMVTINLDGGVKAKVVKQDNLSGDSLTAQSSVVSFESTFAGRIKRGNYVLVASDNQKYQDALRSFSVGSKPVTINISLDYSDAELSSLLAKELPAINRSFNSKYASVEALSTINYQISSGELFKRGDWFGALLVPGDSQYDTFRLVMQKVNGEWKVVTDPPSIIISSVVYPNIPASIIGAVNAL